MMRLMGLSKNARMHLLLGVQKNSYSSAYISYPETPVETKKRTFGAMASITPSTTLFQAPTQHTENPGKKHKRLKSAYQDNITAALELPCTAEELEKFNAKTLFETSKALIIEHSSRRVDLFFYTLIAYYKTKTTPKQGHTQLQHGFGRNLINNKNVTQGCHSSFLPSLIENSDNSGLLSGNHFMDSLNSTVELPPYVNELDNEFENTCFGRKKSLEILTQVAQGKLDPIQGLNQFLIMMDTIFNEIEANPFRIEKFFCKYRKISDELLKLTKLGTLNEKLHPKKKLLNPAYLELLLRLTPEEKQASKTQAGLREKLFRMKIEEIQQEILNTKTSFSVSLT
jgi:hypothetical protein